MGKISYSQFSQWDKCPQMWKLNYLDKLGTFQGNIYTIFGSALHETIQAYLVAYYNKTIKIADSLPLGDILQYRMEENYKQTKENSEVPVEVTLEEMKSFYQDGLNIIEEFLKRKNSYFPKKDHELLGIELDIDFNLPKDMRFVGFMDVVIHNKKTGRVRIIDIKTSTHGWNKYMKADKNKTNQLLLYKKFFSKQRDIPEDKIDIEYLILKRKLYENIQYPQKRLQVFSPASGKPSLNKVITRLQEFIDDCFDDKGELIQKDYFKNVSTKNCKYCEFKNKPDLCDRKQK
jgi:RecB family exonuclease|tara:strand:- start:410 stop:1276 length:867 start_codon:yes stop_codon:yes gene_type:complete